MFRCVSRCRYLALLAGAVTIFAAVGGCNVLTMGVYLIKGNDEPADYDGLKEKRVVVVCRPVAGIHYSDSDVARTLAKQVAGLIKENLGESVDVVDHREVEDWLDNHQWDEYTEIGEALDAQMVVGIDLEEYRLLEDQTLFQGNALANVKVFDCTTTGREVYDNPIQVQYPNTPTTYSGQRAFQRKFVSELAGRIGRLFYPHDRYIDMGKDATAW